MKGQDKPFDLNSQKQVDTSSFDNVLKTKVSDSKVEDRVNIGAKVEPRMDRPEKIVKQETVIPKDEGDSSTEPPEVEKPEKEVVNDGKPGTDKSEKLRQKVMLEFMDSMENEFGIPPEEVAEAMTTIPVDKALKSPEQTASLVIKKLDLPDEDEKRALELYLGMLEQLKQTPPPLTPKLVNTPVAAGMLAGAAALSAQNKKEALNHSLDRLNEQFFMRGQYAPQIKTTPQPIQMMDQGSAPLKDLAANTPQTQSPQRELTPVPAANLGVQNPVMDLESQEAIPIEGMEQVDPSSTEAKALLSALAALGASATAIEKSLPKDPQAQQALKAEQLMNQLKAEGLVSPKLQSNDVKAIAGLGFAANKDDDSDEQADLSSADQFFVHQDSHLRKSDQRDLGQIGNKDFTTAMSGAAVAKAGDSQQEAANVQRLMNQAQYLLKKGGGEAKIQMAPEGIGQVHMKMTLLDGKVNLEMQAETKEAKKLIESSIGELKAQLGSHNLTMDRLKVDVGNQASMDMKNDSQKQNFDNSQERPKDQTRNFWSEFNGNGTGSFERRNMFNENSGIRAYGGSRRADPLKAVESNVAPTTRAKESGKGRGLDLVA